MIGKKVSRKKGKGEGIGMEAIEERRRGIPQARNVFRDRMCQPAPPKKCQSKRRLLSCPAASRPAGLPS